MIYGFWYDFKNGNFVMIFLGCYNIDSFIETLYVVQAQIFLNFSSSSLNLYLSSVVILYTSTHICCSPLSSSPVEAQISLVQAQIYI